MKTIQIALLSLFALALFSCSGSSSSSANNPFGELPNLFVKYEAEVPSLSGLKRKDVTPEIMKELQSKTEALIDQIDKEAPKIVGNKVPFSGNPSPLFEFTDCIISSAERNMNECRVEVDVLYSLKNTSDTQGSDTPLYALFVGHSDNPLYYTKFRTTTSGDVNKISKLFLQLPRQKLADFKEIRLITEAELQQLLNNTK